MPSVVVVPCWRRPELLAATLTRLRLARGVKEHAFLFALDREHDETNLEVIRALFPKDKIYYRLARRQHSYQGAGYNILESLRDALTMKPELVYLVEDDTLVAEDFFEYHEAAHAIDEDAFAVSAGRNERFDKDGDHRFVNKLADGDRVDAIYRHTSYQPIGTSIKVEFLPEILEHANRAYYEHPVDYCVRVLDDPNLEYGACSPSDLIHRIARRRVWWSVYPFVPRAYHAGWARVSDELGLEGTSWQVRAERTLAMTDDEINKLGELDETQVRSCQLARDPTIALRLTELPRGASMSVAR